MPSRIAIRVLCCSLAFFCGANSQIAYNVFNDADPDKVPRGTIVIAGVAIPPGAQRVQLVQALAGPGPAAQPKFAVYDAISVDQKLASTVNGVNGDLKRLQDLIGEEHAIIKK